MTPLILQENFEIPEDLIPEHHDLDHKIRIVEVNQGPKNTFYIEYGEDNFEDAENTACIVAMRCDHTELTHAVQQVYERFYGPRKTLPMNRWNRDLDGAIDIVMCCIDPSCAEPLAIRRSFINGHRLSDYDPVYEKQAQTSWNLFTAGIDITPLHTRLMLNLKHWWTVGPPLRRCSSWTLVC